MVAELLSRVERRGPGLHRHVVGVEDHVPLGQRLDRVLAEGGEAARVAVRRRRVERQRDVRQAELGDRTEQRVLLLGADAGGGGLVLVVALAVGGAQCRMSQNEPVSRNFAALTSGPTAPVSPATPARALSNLLTNSIWRTPILRTSSSWRSMSEIEQAGTSAFIVQPNGTLVSMPMTTAIFPALITFRASKGSSRSGRSPCPGRRTGRRCSPASCTCRAPGAGPSPCRRRSSA